MTIKKAVKKKTKSKSRQSNPVWIDKILGRSRVENDSVNITVTDGTLILKGDTLSTSFPELNQILETKLSNFKIEFQPIGTNKRYIINRPKSKIKESSTDGVDEMRQLGRRSRRFQ